MPFTPDRQTIKPTSGFVPDTRSVTPKPPSILATLFDQKRVPKNIGSGGGGEFGKQIAQTVLAPIKGFGESIARGMAGVGTPGQKGLYETTQKNVAGLTNSAQQIRDRLAKGGLPLAEQARLKKLLKSLSSGQQMNTNLISSLAKPEMQVAGEAVGTGATILGGPKVLTKRGATTALASGVLGGGLNKILGGDVQEGAARGIGITPQLMGITQFTNPAIERIAGGTAQHFTGPVGQNLATRGARGLANIPEGMLINLGLGEKNTPSSMGLDFLMGLAGGGRANIPGQDMSSPLTKQGIVDQAGNEITPQSVAAKIKQGLHFSDLTPEEKAVAMGSTLEQSNEASAGFKPGERVQADQQTYAKGRTFSDIKVDQPEVRPAHQVALEEAWKAGDMTKAQQIINDMPDSDPYKASMQDLMNQKQQRAIIPPKGALPQDTSAFEPGQEGQPLRFLNEPVTTKPDELGGDMRERGFLKTVKESDATTEELRKQVGEINPQTYQQESNDKGIMEANKLIAADPDAVLKRVLSNEGPSAEKAILAQQLAKKYMNEGSNEVATNIIETYDRQAREAGQFIQPAKLWSQATPEGFLTWANKTIIKANDELDSLTKLGRKILGKEDTKLSIDEKTQILSLMQKAGEATTDEEKQSFTKQALEIVNQKIPMGVSDYIDAYRYENMLSNPKPHERNIASNLFNTFITRPYELGTESTVDWARSSLTGKDRETYIKDVPEYYKAVFNSFGDSWTAAKEAYKSDWIGKEQELTNMKTAKLPPALTFIPRAMEAQDKYFSTMISAGEYARLMSHGKVGEDEAKKAAQKIAEEYLYRIKLDAKNTDNSLFVRALDGLGESIQQGGKIPVFGRALRWFVPFVRTPINYAKANIERSPLGLAGGKLDNPQIAKALAGSTLMGVGALAAMQGKTVWEAPSDPKAKEAFYGTGRKPYSVTIGGQSVPFWYLYPYALAFAIPAAFKYYSDESKTSLTDDQLAKATQAVAAATKFLASQTPMQGLSGFYRLLDGDVDFTLPNLAASTLSQGVPAEGLLRYVNNFVDPVFRKSKGFTETLQKSIPGMSTDLEPYRNPAGEPSKREMINNFIPYDIGTLDKRFEPSLKNRQKQLQFNSQVNGLVREVDQTVDKNIAPLQATLYQKLDAAPGFQSLPTSQKELLRNKLKTQLKTAMRQKVLLEKVQKIRDMITNSPTKNQDEKLLYLQTLRQQGLLPDSVLNALGGTP